MCSTRSGSRPGGRTGISNWRKANQFRSISVAYPMAAAPTAVVAGMSVRIFTHLWCHGHRRAAVADDRRSFPRMGLVAELKERLRADLNAAMRARDQVRMRTLRMALSSITNAEVAGASARELSPDEVMKVLTREASKARDAPDAFAAPRPDD